MGTAALVAGYIKRFGAFPRMASGGATPLSVTFPTSPLTTRVHIALGADLTASWLTWNWLDITDYVRHDLGITVTTGRQDERGRVNPSRCQIKLENTDGRFTRRNPLGPYYGLLTPNTPIWIEIDPGSGFVDRYYGFINEWPVRWTDPSETDCYVTIQCSGVLRRLAQGRVLRAPLYNTVSQSAAAFYWPLDDGTGATKFASGLAAGQALSFVGTPSLAAAEFAGSRPVAAFTATAADQSPSFIGSPALSSTELTLSFVWRGDLADPPDSASYYPITLLLAGGTFDELNFFIGSEFDGGEFLNCSVDFINYGISVAFNGFDGEPHAVTFRMRQVGSDFHSNTWIDGVDRGSAIHGGDTLGALIGIRGPVPVFAGYSSGIADSTGSTLAMGHLAIHTSWDALDPVDFYDAMTAWDGEMAHERIRRVCEDQGITLYCQASTSAQLGPQPIGTPLDIMRDAEQADLGVLYEYQFGLGYQALSERYNQAVVLNLDFDAGHIAGTPEPADDDQRLVNRFTASRSDGSEATEELATGTLGTGPGGAGVYDDSGTVNVYSDDQLNDYAGWKVHLGTVDEDRWPQIGLYLHGSPDLIPDWLAVPFGARINIANPPPQMPQQTIDGIIEGHTERWDTVSWSAALNISPASGFTVSELDDTDQRLDSGSSTLAADVTAGASSLSVATSDSRDLWSTSGSDYPQEVTISGIHVTVTAVSGGSSPQTFTVTGATVTKALTAGDEVHVRYPFVLAL